MATELSSDLMAVVNYFKLTFCTFKFLLNILVIDSKSKTGRLTSGSVVTGILVYIFTSSRSFELVAWIILLSLKAKSGSGTSNVSLFENGLLLLPANGVSYPRSDIGDTA